MFLGALQPSPVSKNVQTPVLPREAFFNSNFSNPKKRKNTSLVWVWTSLLLGLSSPQEQTSKPLGLSSPQCLGSPAHSGRALQPTNSRWRALQPTVSNGSAALFGLLCCVGCLPMVPVWLLYYSTDLTGESSLHFKYLPFSFFPSFSIPFYSFIFYIIFLLHYFPSFFIPPIFAEKSTS